MKIGLFIPCYINAVYPHVGIACYKLLVSLGMDVDYPVGQTCCGQPMANGGFETGSVYLAERFEDLFPRLLAEAKKGECTAAKHIYDITEFLHDVIKPEKFPSKFPHKVSIHNSCHGVRELGLSSPSELTVPYFNKIRSLLERVPGITVVEPKRVDECCGFGGLFAVEESEVSACMGRDKVKDHMSTGAEYITGADSSCLMHMNGVIEREHYPIQTIHYLEILSAQL